MSIERDPQPVPGGETVAVDREWFDAAMERGVPWPTGRTYVLTHPARPVTLNKGRTLHYHARAEHDDEWRGVFHLLAKEARVPQLAAIEVTVLQEMPDRAHMPDVGAPMFSVKAAIDGVVDAGVIPDDDPEHVVRLIFEAPQVTGRDALSLVLREVA